MTARLRSLAVVTALFSAAIFLPPPARADRDNHAVFLLGSGGRLEGDLVNGDETPRKKYVVQTALGAVVTLQADQVKEVVRRSPTELEYETLRHQQPDTPAGQMALADWCRDHKLEEQRKLHLKRVLELDPAHEKARGQLGYHMLGGQWKTRDEHMTALGKVPYKGDWMYPQEIEIVEKKAEATRQRQEWVANLKRWSDWFGGPKEQTARANIAAIVDPAAFPALQDAMKPDNYPVKKRTIPDPLAEMYVQALGRIGNYEAYKLLADLSLIDPYDEVRAASLDLLLKDPQPSIVNHYMQQLRSTDNLVVNRAAYALKRFKDERAVSPLIDALVTKHKFAVTSGNSGGGMSASNGPGGPGLSMGSRTDVFTKDIENMEVLNALITITNGTNYQYNIDAWKQWYAGRRKNKFQDARRS
jgi:hypothetical protein